MAGAVPPSGAGRFIRAIALGRRRGVPQRASAPSGSKVSRKVIKPIYRRPEDRQGVARQGGCTRTRRREGFRKEDWRLLLRDGSRCGYSSDRFRSATSDGS